jgi:hypothetical protein
MFEELLDAGAEAGPDAEDEEYDSGGGERDRSEFTRFVGCMESMSCSSAEPPTSTFDDYLSTATHMCQYEVPDILTLTRLLSNSRVALRSTRIIALSRIVSRPRYLDPQATTYPQRSISVMSILLTGSSTDVFLRPLLLQPPGVHMPLHSYYHALLHLASFYEPYFLYTEHTSRT